MAGRDYDSFLAALRLHREKIKEAILVIEHLVRSENSSGKPPSWATVTADPADDDDHDHITYQQMLYTLQENRQRVEEAIAAIEKLAHGREGGTPASAKREKKSIPKTKRAPVEKKRSKAK